VIDPTWVLAHAVVAAAFPAAALHPGSAVVAGQA
jgi:hypothetical protein